MLCKVILLCILCFLCTYIMNDWPFELVKSSQGAHEMLSHFSLVELFNIIKYSYCCFCAINMRLCVFQTVNGAVLAYEVPPPQNVLRLPVVRQAGNFGIVTVYWEALPITASRDDFTPSSGNLSFSDGQVWTTVIHTLLSECWNSTLPRTCCSPV